MAEEANSPVVNPSEGDKVEPEAKKVASEGASGTIPNGNMEVETTSGPKDVATDAPGEIEPTKSTTTNAEQTTSDDVTQDKPTTVEEDIEMKDDTKTEDAAATAESSAEPTVGTPVSASKPTGRRKSGGVPEHKGKKLNKKASKAKMTHSDAKPGDYFYVRLKGYPLWPGIVCDESMLPNTLLKTRPVTAAREDGTYRADYEDGGPKVKDRTFPMMYLHTNEFSWIPNYDLVEIDFDDVANVSTNMRKDLAAARILAAEKHDLDYFKEILKNFMEQREADRLAKEAAKAEKKAKKAASKKEKKSAGTVADDEDVDMADAFGEPDDEAEPSAGKTNTNGKRTNDDSEPRPEVKRPKTTIKLNTPKTTNGTSTPKSAKEPASAKSTSKKSKKATAKTLVAETPEIAAPKELELSAEEKRAKREKEIMFLRHKLQKGLLIRNQSPKEEYPKEEEMKQMSEFVTKLEGYADLEVSIIRATKINKVLKAILKMSTIPKEEEFQFKPRSQSLLDKWNKLLASEQGTPAVAAPATNGTATERKSEEEETKASPIETTNGTKESSADKAEEEVSTEEPSAPETKEAIKAQDEDVKKESVVQATAVESTA